MHFMFRMNKHFAALYQPIIQIKNNYVEPTKTLCTYNTDNFYPYNG